MIASFKSRALRNYWTKGNATGIDPKWLKKVRLILSALDSAENPAELDLPGLGFHTLKGNRKGEFAVCVSGNWRITFSFAEQETLRHPGVEPGHPADLLSLIILPATGKSKVEIAQLLGISRQTLYDILGKRQSITPAIAIRLGKLFGNGPNIWLRMQQSYDLWHAQEALAEDLAKIKPLPRADLLRDVIGAKK